MTVMHFSRIGGPNSIVLPDDILDAVKAKPGDKVTVTITKAGVIQIAPQNSSPSRELLVSEQVEKARAIAKRYNKALRELAK